MNQTSSYTTWWCAGRSTNSSPALHLIGPIRTMRWQLDFLRRFTAIARDLQSSALFGRTIGFCYIVCITKFDNARGLLVALLYERELVHTSCYLLASCDGGVNYPNCRKECDLSGSKIDSLMTNSFALNIVQLQKIIQNWQLVFSPINKSWCIFSSKLYYLLQSLVSCVWWNSSAKLWRLSLDWWP